MFKTTLLSLVIFSLPAMADSINFLAQSNWTSIGNVSVLGVDALSYSKTDDSTRTSVGADVTMGGSNGEYTISGSLYGSQGYGTGPVAPDTSSRVSISLDLPTDSGNWLYTVTDQMTDSHFPGPGDYTCQIGLIGGSVSGSSPVTCSAPMTSSRFNHLAGTPLSVAFLFGEPLLYYGQSFQEQFSVTLSEVGGSEPPVTTPTPEPPPFALRGLPLVGFAIVRRRLTQG